MKIFRKLSARILGVFTLTITISAHAADGDTFTEKTIEGIELTYQIISEAERTCEVAADQDENAINGDLTIPNSVQNYLVVAIGDKAFYGCYHLTSISIPNSVTKIGNRAFSFSWLRTISIPNSVTEIGDGAFDACSKLTSISIPNSITKIGSDVFFSSGLTSVSIPNSVTEIGDDAFACCDGLKNISIPNSVTKISGNTFSGCNGLEGIVVESGNMFYDSRENCNAIIETKTNTLISGCVKTIIPSSVTAIGPDAFFGLDGLTSIYFPNSITEIGDYAFACCDGLKTIILPGMLQRIGNRAFFECESLTDIILPKSLNNIGEGIFNFCKNLKNVTSRIRNPFDVFAYSPFYGLLYGNSVDITLHVPYGTKSLYENCSNWEDFPNIVEMKELNINDTFVAKSIDGNDVTYQVLDQAYHCRVGDGNNAAILSSSVQNLTIEEMVYCPEIAEYYTVESVAGNAFSGSSSIIGISFPETIKTLGEQMFKDCSNLATIQWNADAPLSPAAMEGISNPNFLLYVKNKDYAPSGSWNVVANGIAEDIILEEVATGNNFYCPKKFIARNIEYTHHYSMTSGYHTCAGWETLALPFDVEKITYEQYVGMMPISQWQVGSSLRPFWLYEHTSDGWKAATAIKGNIPYIICMPNNKDSYQDQYNISGDVTFSATNAQVLASDSVVVVKYNGRQFVPNYLCQGAKSKIYAMNVNNQWEQYASPENKPGSLFISGLRSVHPFEAYMATEGVLAPQYIPIFEDGLPTDATIPIKQQEHISNGSIYDLTGRKIGRFSDIKIQKGIYIVNGKKTIIK